jgi:hypothetical protein
MIPTNDLIIEAIKIIEEPFKNKDKKPLFINLKDSESAETWRKGYDTSRTRKI